MEEIGKIKKYAKITSVPIIKDEGINFICDYIREHDVEKILEIGITHFLFLFILGKIF